MSKLDFSLDHSIANLINNYIDPIFPIYKITYLHTKSYLTTVYHKYSENNNESIKLILLDIELLV